MAGWRIYKTRHFGRWARLAGLPDAALLEAVREMERGLIDANLGGRIIKKRIRVTGRGKSGGARVLVATNSRDTWFFVYGFLKNERSNITQRELLALRSLARDLLSLTEEQLNEETHRGALTQVR